MIATSRRTSAAGRLSSDRQMLLLELLGVIVAANLLVAQAVPGFTAADESKPDDAPLPVASEQAAAAKVRTLGGWYVLDAERHVIEVNMCHHYDSDGERHENEQKTDEALAQLPGFPRLKRLLLCETQVSNDGLEYVGRLRELEELFIWDGADISDKGVAHLRTLPKLKILLLGRAAITDEAVAHLSLVSTLETLLLDSNGLSDKSLEFASALPRLQELEVGNWDPEARQATITATGLVHIRKMPALKKLGIPLVPEAVDDLRQLHGLKGLELLTIENAHFQGTMNEAAIAALQQATPQLKVIADRMVFPSLERKAAGADPKQHEIYRRHGKEGVQLIEKFLELTWARRDGEAGQLCDLNDDIAELKRFRREPGFVPFKVSMAYADSENVLAITEPPVTYKVYDLEDGKRREIGKRTAHVIMRAVRINGTWRIRNSYQYDVQPGSDALLKWFQKFLTEYPGAQALRPTAQP